MGDLARYFSRREFACKCGCGFDTVDAELLEVLTVVREHFDAPVTITSGCRCAEHNAAVGGSPNSQHLLGRAADIVVKGVPAIEVYRYLNLVYQGELGLGRYQTFTHVDTRSTAARWDHS